MSIRASSTSSSPSARTSEPASAAQVIGGGVLGAVAAIALGQIAYQAAGGGRLCGDDPCGLVVGILSTAIFEPVLVPLGAHFANHRRGNLGLSLLASSAAGAGALLLWNVTDTPEPFVALAPIVQIAVAALVERATSHQE